MQVRVVYGVCVRRQCVGAGVSLLAWDPVLCLRVCWEEVRGASRGRRLGRFRGGVLGELTLEHILVLLK